MSLWVRNECTPQPSLTVAVGLYLSFFLRIPVTVQSKKKQVHNREVTSGNIVNDGKTSIIIFDRYSPEAGTTCVNYGKWRGPKTQRWLSCSGSSAADFADIEQRRFDDVIRKIKRM